jgi:putative DNA topoisomerase
MSKIDESLFSAHEHALDKAYHVCPKCGGELTLKHSKAGSFLGCSNYPNCDYIRQTHEHGILKELDDKACPECGANLALKQGKFGMFIGCTQFPQCHHHQSIEETDDTHVACPDCDKGSLIQRKSRYGKLFYACDQYPKCKFAVNFKPVEGTCSECGFKLLLEKSKGDNRKLVCASKVCGKVQHN